MGDSETEVAAAKAREDLARSLRRAAWNDVLATASGRLAIELVIFEFGGFEEQSYHPDSHQRSFHDGQRAVAIHLNRELYLTARDGWARMRAERDERLRLIATDPRPNKTDQ